MFAGAEIDLGRKDLGGQAGCRQSGPGCRHHTSAAPARTALPISLLCQVLLYPGCFDPLLILAQWGEVCPTACTS